MSVLLSSRLRRCLPRLLCLDFAAFPAFATSATSRLRAFNTAALHFVRSLTTTFLTRASCLPRVFALCRCVRSFHRHTSTPRYLSATFAPPRHIKKLVAATSTTSHSSTLSLACLPVCLVLLYSAALRVASRLYLLLLLGGTSHQADCKSRSPVGYTNPLPLPRRPPSLPAGPSNQIARAVDGTTSVRRGFAWDAITRPTRPSRLT